MGGAEKQRKQKTCDWPWGPLSDLYIKKVKLKENDDILTKSPPSPLLQVVVATAKKRVLKRLPARSSKGGFRDPPRRSRRRSRKFPELSRRGVRRASTARACLLARSCSRRWPVWGIGQAPHEEPGVKVIDRTSYSHIGGIAGHSRRRCCGWSSPLHDM